MLEVGLSEEAQIDVDACQNLHLVWLDSGKPVVIFPPPPTFPAHKSIFHLSRVGGINQ